MKNKTFVPILAVLLLAIVGSLARLGAQNAPQSNTTPVQATQSLYYTIPISATAAVNTATTLTIPAPPAGLYNYVCSLSIDSSNDNTGTAVTNVATSSTNFNSFALKFSHTATASGDYTSPVYKFGDPATGCAKSTSPGTATTFVSAASQTHDIATWTATYYQAP